MGIFGDMINYIIDMGASAMLPLVIDLKYYRRSKNCKAVRAGLMAGVGFMIRLIVDMMNATLDQLQ